MIRHLLSVSLVSVIALSACQSQDRAPTAPVDTRITESITSLGIATIARQSGNVDENGIAMAPFSAATVHFGVNNPAPKLGLSIQMWPLRNDPPPLNVKVTKVDPMTACEGNVDGRSMITGTPERMAEILAVKSDPGKSAEFPFELAYVTPPQPQAKLVQPPSTLPPSITSATVKFALDLNNDGNADALYIATDCDSGGPVTGETGATCTASYVLKETKWVLLDSTAPC